MKLYTHRVEVPSLFSEHKEDSRSMTKKIEPVSLRRSMSEEKASTPLVTKEPGKDEEQKWRKKQLRSTETKNTLDLMKKDLAEFGDAMTKEVEKGAAIGFGWVKSVVDTVTDTVKRLAVEDTTRGEDEITKAIRPRIFRRPRDQCCTDYELRCSSLIFKFFLLPSAILLQNRSARQYSSARTDSTDDDDGANMQIVPAGLEIP
ncbi:hypothetical protein ANCCAN_09028 [Ancylostoma caninum]|uniref:Uncharacterized protein n=1 Tax=Ancylostoma caninum TaxID=29170 RepID=A0A368GKW1_ANCCA|nr:hypothetical protein ANCCAN_09028 [Ancylostoma caninum]